MIISDLRQEKARLDEIIEEIEPRIAAMPEGSLRITRAGDHPHFRQYFRKDDGKFIERYLQKNDADLAAKLAQKSYDLSVLKQARKESKLIGKLLNCYEATVSLPALNKAKPAQVPSIKQLYARLSKERRALVVPHELPDDEYAALWEQENKRESLFRPAGLIFETEKGHKVRSKSEVIISDKLFRSDVPYLYENPMHLEGFGPVSPDFTILNKRTRQQFVWEHFGMMDDPDYRNSALKKIAAYAKAGMPLGAGLIATFESATHPLDMAVVDANIEMMLK